jgi:hypothetical protein
MVVSAIGARVRNSPQGGISSTHATSLGWGRWCAPATVRHRPFNGRIVMLTERMQHMIDDVLPGGFLPTICGTDL